MELNLYKIQPNLNVSIKHYSALGNFAFIKEMLFNAIYIFMVKTYLELFLKESLFLISQNII